MRPATTLLVLASIHTAQCQMFDPAAMAAIASVAQTVTSASIPVVYKTNPTAAALTAVTSTYLPSVALSAVSAAISLNPSSAVLSKRATTLKTSTTTSTPTCLPQPTGISYRSNPDSAAAFAADSYYSKAALSAYDPPGYVTTFTNLNASNNAYGYMGYTLMPTYDVAACSARCDSVKGCLAFNIYFERDPTVNPNSPNCANPASTTQIKCVYWGGTVTPQNAVNYGEYRNNFHVVIAGSNGYVNQSISIPPGYGNITYLNKQSINSPIDCNGHNAYMTYKLFTTGPFDAALCAAACSSVSAANLKRGPVNGKKPQTCQFFTAYILYKNGAPLGQYCALYDRAFQGTKNAVNGGYTYNGDVYTIDYSYSFTNMTNAGSAPTC